MSISVGIVGVGSFGAGFIRLFKDHPKVSRLALCDLNEQRLADAARKHGVSETYPSLDEICKSDIQALAIITQPWLHAPQAIQAMEAGKHVYSAVPVISLPDSDQMLEWCDKVIDACKRTGMQYMMGETSYYRPQAMYCRRRADAGDFGYFVQADGDYLHDVDSPRSNLRQVAKSRWGDDWDISKSGDAPMHYPTHSFGGFLSVMKCHATEVTAMGYQMPGDDWHRADTVFGNLFGNETAMLRLSNGAVARVREYRRIGHVGREAFQLFGTEGSFTDGAGGCYWVTREKAVPVTVEQMRDPLPAEVLAAYGGDTRDDSVYGGHGGSHAYLVNEFVDAADAGRLPAINAWEAVRYLAPGIMAHKSASNDGEMLKVPDWGDPPSR